MGALEATFQVLTVISCIFVRSAPWPDFQCVYKAKTTGEMQILPVVMLFTNCVMLVSICGVPFAVIVLVFLYGAIGVAGLTKQSKSSMATAMGAISISTSIGLDKLHSSNWYLERGSRVDDILKLLLEKDRGHTQNQYEVGVGEVDDNGDDHRVIEYWREQ
ncbi:hypothetical protein PC112_g12289 [Phytophthora cactorum]|nr:hypothetical protein PC112_g12289 [Phytophthora cactorum]